MKNLLNDRKVQIGVGAAVLLGALWFLLAGGEEVEEANTAPEAAAVVAPATVESATNPTANSLTETPANTDVTNNTTTETTETTDNTNQ